MEVTPHFFKACDGLKFEGNLHFDVFRTVLALILLHLTLLGQNLQLLLERLDFCGPLKVHGCQNLLVRGGLWPLELDRDYDLNRCMGVVRAVR